ncbi:MAG: S-methyl-5-thioribose-1-phosphate isomerase [Planctomycetota bacterium]
MPVPTIEWVGEIDGHVRLLDQTLLPIERRFVECRDVETVWEAIRSLRVRGAPAIGIAAAMGLVLGVRDGAVADGAELLAEVERVADYLATARPTAVNLFWALDRMKRVAEESSDRPPDEIRRRLLAEANAIREEDRAVCRRIGRHGAELIKDGDTVLTHCNAGALATADYGTALACIYTAHEQGKQVRVFADETRPLLQGARLTTWELMEAGIETTLICDSTAALVMKQGKVNLVIVGADRIAANGDTANKIGTYGLAVLAGEHDVPFYVAAPLSTFDLSLEAGAEIPIEERSGDEITCGFGRRTAPEGVRTYSPAFDVTPAHHITAIVTERGVISYPTTKAIAEHFRGTGS